MKKYISVEDLERSISESHNTTALNNKECNQLYSEVYRAIDKAQPMVSVEDIEMITRRYRISGILDENKFRMMLKDIDKLITPQPKKYGGLTVDEWYQLLKLHNIRIILEGAHGYYLNIDTLNKAMDKIELAPDPEGHYRHHNGGESPLPANVLIEIGHTKSLVMADDKVWRGCVFGYRIIGVSDE